MTNQRRASSVRTGSGITTFCFARMRARRPRPKPGLVLAQALKPQAAGLFQDESATPRSGLRDWTSSRVLCRNWSWPDFNDEFFAELLESVCQGKTSARRRSNGSRFRSVPAKPAHVQSSSASCKRAHPGDRRSPADVRFAWFTNPVRPPILAVRLQELFGWTETPRVARGRVPVLLHFWVLTTGRSRSPTT